MRRQFLAASLAVIATPAMAQTPPVLVKVVSPRDEVVVAAGMDLDALARKLVADGQVGAWQYAVRRAADGSTEYGPLRRVAIMRQDTLRLEAFDPRPLKAVPLPQ